MSIPSTTKDRLDDAHEIERMIDAIGRGERPTWLDLERVVNLNVAAKIRGVSRDTIRRHHAHLIRELSPRRKGMKLRDVLNV